MHTKLIATAAVAVALAGCAPKAPPPPPAVDLQNEGMAKTCTPSAVDLAAAAAATITLTNDGWCGLFTAEKDGQPFKYGLVKTRPEHGHVFIRPVNGQTRVEYTANPGYAGADRFAVALASHAENTPDVPLRVDVTVTPGEGQSAAPPAPAPAPAKKPAPAHHAPTRRHTTR